MMMGGLGVLAILVLIAVGLLGWMVVWRFLPAILAAIGAGTLAGFLAALAAESRERRQRQRPHPRPGAGAGAGRKPGELRCPWCGSPITPEQAVCPTCFRDLKRNCPSCGAIVAVWEARCPECGQALKPLMARPETVQFETTLPKEVS